MCAVPGCDGKGRVCDVHWFLLPMALRQRWWSETNYGKNEPSPELIMALEASVRPHEDK